jgi:RNA polymerase sigma-70 factor (ECF subfamily)
MSLNSTPLFKFGRRQRLRAAVCEQRPRLYRIAWSWCHDAALADDLVQETLARALEKLDRLREEQRLDVWLTTILANLFRDQYRRITPETGLETDLGCAGDTPEQATDRDQMVERTRAAIDDLNPDQRQVVTLVDLADFSYAQTATILAVPVGTVMSRLARARRQLRVLLEQEGISSSQVVPLRKAP